MNERLTAHLSTSRALTAQFRSSVWARRALWLRVLFCWALISTFPFFDEGKNYDFRLQVRGPQARTKQIVVIKIDLADWIIWSGRSPSPRATKDIRLLSDKYFWRADAWDDLLGHVLAQDPKAIGVAFFFAPDLPRPSPSLKNIRDQRIQWAAQLDGEGRLSAPVMAAAYNHNVGLVSLREDEDHVLRRFDYPNFPGPSLALKVAEFDDPTMADAYPPDNEARLIDFRGPATIFPSISALNVLSGRVPPNFFTDKIVLIGTDSLPALQTPMGKMSRADVLAQIVDNMLAHRWIHRLPPWLSSFYLLLVLLLSMGIITNYPSGVATLFLLWLALGNLSLSAWAFDTFNLWVPGLSAIAVLFVSYIVFIGYQLTIKENQTWQLEREKQLLSEVDQLRNNFVSLISHDLKTPIAKIQAICDRLMTGQVAREVREGLGLLRQESMELHRYIHSILQISRLESNKVQLRKEPVDLNELVEKVLVQIRPLADDKQLLLMSVLEPMFSLEVDGVLVQEVILNLIENAVKYTPAGGEISVQTREVNDKVIFSVTDTGPGIPIGDREHLFEKFYRGQAHQSETKGTGLGLFLVKYFIELHGGEVFLESEVEVGTRIGFVLPLTLEGSV